MSADTRKLITAFQNANKILKTLFLLFDFGWNLLNWTATVL